MYNLPLLNVWNLELQYNSQNVKLARNKTKQKQKQKQTKKRKKKKGKKKQTQKQNLSMNSNENINLVISKGVEVDCGVLEKYSSIVWYPH